MPEGRWPTGDSDVCYNTVTACVRNLLLMLAADKYDKPITKIIRQTCYAAQFGIIRIYLLPS